jgi:nitrogen fixation protein NifU and related proteins
MGDLRELYQETILDHSRHPKNFGVLEGATHRAKGHNPLCGDTVEVALQLEGDRVADIKFRGQGCAISTASASLMTEALRGKTVDQALALFRKLHETVTGQAPDTARNGSRNDEGAADVELGKLSVLEGVKQYPLRVKCATLAWHALRNALMGHDREVAVTE